MGYSVNKVTILGNVGKDPEIRSTQSGTRIANFTVATSEQWRDRNSGEKKEKTEWHRITVWPEHMVTLVENYVRKGDKIYLEGKLETRKWTDQQGQDKYSTEIVIKQFHGDITLIGNTRGNGNSNGRLADRGQSEGDAYEPPQQQRSGGGYGELDDEIPF